MADVDLPDSALRKALEFAVTMAALWSRQGDAPPAAMRPFLRSPKLAAAQLRKVRVVLDGDATFRERVGSAAGGGAVDEVGVLWLTRPDGWQQRIAELAATAGGEAGVALDDVRREIRRRLAAEEARARSDDERDAAVAALDAARAATIAAHEEVDRLRAELSALQVQHAELRSTARRRTAGSHADAEAIQRLEAEVASLTAELAEVNDALDRALADRTHGGTAPADVDRARTLLRQALGALQGEGGEQRPSRQPLQVPGKFTGDHEGAAEHLFRTPKVVVLIDGYNVAMTAWPGLAIDEQRDRLIAGVDGLARRWGTRVQIVFDGTDIAGAHAARPRHLHVEFSPHDVTADDVIVDRVGSFDPTVPVVVVTNDQGLVRRVRRLGANTVASDTLAALLRR